MEAEDVGEPTMGESSLTDIVFSWSIEDVLNDDLYKNKLVIFIIKGSSVDMLRTRVSCFGKANKGKLDKYFGM